MQIEQNEKHVGDNNKDKIKTMVPFDKNTEHNLRKFYQLLKNKRHWLWSPLYLPQYFGQLQVLDYFGSFLQVLIYLDISINCLCLWLMFKWNTKYFQLWCKSCLWLNIICCFRLTKSDQLKRISHQLQLQSINSISLQTLRAKVVTPDPSHVDHSTGDHTNVNVGKDDTKTKINAVSLDVSTNISVNIKVQNQPEKTESNLDNKESTTSQQSQPSDCPPADMMDVVGNVSIESYIP